VFCEAAAKRLDIGIIEHDEFEKAAEQGKEGEGDGNL
jgi:hypothetical protein